MSNSLWYSYHMNIVEDQDNELGQVLVRNILAGLMTSGWLYASPNITIADDDTLLPRHVPTSFASPYAMPFISLYPLYHLLHALFAMADPALVTFTTILYDLIKILEENWHILLQAIDDGHLPEEVFARFSDLGKLKLHFQVSL